MRQTVTDLLAPYSDSELMELQGILFEIDPKGLLLKYIEQELELRTYFLEEDSF